ncbi:hypothetical protein [Peristeroidobacter soli]|jgi:hypothetical protein|uniref:hypothetical protein n=1 Tax=Peristeroidobacter soli TaxID=2497877 RepID=UPI00101E1754|nr:hypothetical protein [Peristeroidobacter soli]
MKKAALFVSGLLLSVLASAPAMAEVVRVKVVARVIQAVDMQGALNGKIVPGSRMNGTYVYNTNTPNGSPTPDIGQYHPYVNEARMRFAAGGFVFENVQPTQEIYISVGAEGPSSMGAFVMSSSDNKPLSNGTTVNDIRVEFFGSGSVTQSTALPTVAPTLANYGTKEITITGPGLSYFISADIEAAELIVADAVEISPAAGSFLPNQHFDAALTLPRNSNVVNVIAKANGAPLPIGYPGYCSLVPPPNSAGRPAVLCPAADAVLPQAAGAPIEWTVELSNGAILTETVNWTLQQ